MNFLALEPASIYLGALALAVLAVAFRPLGLIGRWFQERYRASWSTGREAARVLELHRRRRLRGIMYAGPLPPITYGCGCPLEAMSGDSMVDDPDLRRSLAKRLARRRCPDCAEKEVRR